MATSRAGRDYIYNKMGKGKFASSSVGKATDAIGRALVQTMTGMRVVEEAPEKSKKQEPAPRKREVAPSLGEQYGALFKLKGQMKAAHEAAMRAQMMGRRVQAAKGKK